MVELHSKGGCVVFCCDVTWGMIKSPVPWKVFIESNVWSGSALFLCLSLHLWSRYNCLTDLIIPFDCCIFGNWNYFVLSPQFVIWEYGNSYITLFLIVCDVLWCTNLISDLLQQITLGALQGLPPGAQGHLLVKTENGQLQLLRVNTASATPGQLPAAVTTTTTLQQPPNAAYRFQPPQVSTNCRSSLVRSDSTSR